MFVLAKWVKLLMVHTYTEWISRWAMFFMKILIRVGLKNVESFQFTISCHLSPVTTSNPLNPIENYTLHEQVGLTLGWSSVVFALTILRWPYLTLGWHNRWIWTLLTSPYLYLYLTWPIISLILGIMRLPVGRWWWWEGGSTKFSISSRQEIKLWGLSP